MLVETTATRGTVASGSCQRRAAARGHQILVSRPAPQQLIAQSITEVKAGRAADAGLSFGRAIDMLTATADLLVIFGCTELPLAGLPAGLDTTRCVSSLEALAQAGGAALYGPL